MIATIGGNHESTHPALLAILRKAGTRPVRYGGGWRGQWRRQQDGLADVLRWFGMALRRAGVNAEAHGRPSGEAVP